LNDKLAILVTVPNLYWIHKTVVRTMLLLLMEDRYKVVIQMPTHRPYVNNLHHCVNEFMGERDYSYWLNIDADNPPLRNPLDLVVLDKDIIGFPTPVWHSEKEQDANPIYHTGYDYVSPEDAYTEHGPQDGLQPVDAIGTGCFLVAKRVFRHPDLRYGAFFRTWYPDGTMHKGNDIAFSERARRVGFELFCHYDYPCDHLAEIPLRSVKGALLAGGDL